MTGKPKIAVLMDWYLPGTKAGGPVRSVYSLVNLLKSQFDFYIITTDTDLGTLIAYDNIPANKLLQKDGVHYYYFSKNNLNAQTFSEVIKSIDPALIYLNSFWSFHFSISFVRLKSKGLIKAPLLLAPRGMLGKGALGLKPLKKDIFLFFSKIMGWYKYVTFHATQAQEESDVRKKFADARIMVAPNINSSPVVENKSLKKDKHLKLFFLSRVSKVKNLHFALEILKELPADLTIEYDIYGNIEELDYWETCKSIIANLPKNITVIYREQLPFDRVQETIRHYNCLFMPTLNENYGHSIVESLLCGCPVIISDQTPWNDLHQHNAGHAIALDKKQAFIDTVARYAGLSAEAFKKKSDDAKDYISRKISPDAIIQQYTNLFNDCIKMTASKTDLSTFNNDWYKPGKNLFVRVMWYLINLCFFRSPFPFYGPKRVVLRLFGAKVGKGLIIKPHVSIKYPWKLVVGDHVWIGEEVWIDNLAKVTLKDHSCVSQGALLLCGNHNYKKKSFDLIVGEITLEEGAWAGAKTVICPGVRLGANSLLTVGSIATSSIEPGWIYQGNPAKKLKIREVKY